MCLRAQGGLAGRRAAVPGGGHELQLVPLRARRRAPGPRGRRRRRTVLSAVLTLLSDIHTVTYLVELIYIMSSPS